MHSSTAFPRDKTFPHVKALKQSVLEHANRNGFIAVTKRSKPNKVWYQCKHSGEFRNTRRYSSNGKDVSSFRTSKSGCPYFIEASFDKDLQGWKVCDKNTQHNHQCLLILSNIPAIPDVLDAHNNDDETVTVEASVVEETAVSDSGSRLDDVLLAENALVVSNSSNIFTNDTVTALAMANVKDECSDMPIQQPAPEFDALVQMLRESYLQQNEVDWLQIIAALTALTTVCSCYDHDAIATSSGNSSITLQLLNESGKHVCVQITYYFE